ncbi:hypothetical protein MY11210_006289 [Beauveria gryllotalpidicola]
MHTGHRAPLPTTTTASSRPMIHHSSVASATPTLVFSARDASRRDSLGPSPDHIDSPDAALRLLVPVSAAAWVLVGGACILCINGKGRAGRWVPKWYLDSEGTRRDKALVAAWWLGVLLLWPVILPVLLLRKIARVVRKQVARRRQERRERDKGVGRASEV